jgi:hypothetical protein
MTMRAQAAKPGVFAVSSGLLQRKCSCGGNVTSGGECEACKKKKELQRRATQASSPQVAPPIVHEVLQSPGQPLDAATRAYFEPRFGHDFNRISLRSSGEYQRSGLSIGSSDSPAERQADDMAARMQGPIAVHGPRYDLSRIRVHTGTKAAESARAVAAQAYTVGTDVVFGDGQYAPHTPQGRALIAHELTHTVQQQGDSGGLMQRKLGPIAKSGCEIVLVMDIGIYGQRATPALATTWQGWINSLWKGRRGCKQGMAGSCSTRVESKVTAHPDINWWWKVPEANSAFVREPDYRSQTNRPLNTGDWAVNDDDRSIVHEVGHLMGEDDRYTNIPFMHQRSDSGYTNDIMANYYKDPGPTIYSNALNRIEDSNDIDCQCCAVPAGDQPAKQQQPKEAVV